MSSPPSRRAFLRLAGATLAGAALTACAQSPASTIGAAAEPPVTNADEALKRLQEGNQRYVALQATHPNQTGSRRGELAQSQKPFAVVFGCVDSRAAPELVFDRGLGDLFVIRTAGHVLDNAALGSIQYGVAELKIPLIMVLGHERCGAVSATIEAVEKHAEAPDQIATLVKGITPAVEKAHGQPGDQLDNVVRAHTELIVAQLKATPLLAEALSKNALKIVGGRYDLDSGMVEVIVP
jgi:carbonic anhydrase